jgi:hypothetical protein
MGDRTNVWCLAFQPVDRRRRVVMAKAQGRLRSTGAPDIDPQLPSDVHSMSNITVLLLPCVSALSLDAHVGRAPGVGQALAQSLPMSGSDAGRQR